MPWFLWFTLTPAVVSVFLLSAFNVQSFLSENSDFFSKSSFGKILSSEEISKETEDKNTLFVTGDIMLARHVEYLMEQNGGDYPFKNLDFLKEKGGLVLGNFEASIPEIPKKTPNFTFNLWVNKKFLPNLKEAGFSELSLANNHSFDDKKSGFENTKFSLREAGFSVFGHPTLFNENSVSFVTLNKKRVALVALHTLFVKPSDEEIKKVFSYAKENSDFIISYVHWGIEYDPLFSNSQKVLAKKLIAAGSDMIIGHHPHVVQGVEIIDNAPVFYSLGNLIFDQYFSPEVQTGLVLKLTFAEDLKINLIPVTSIGSLASPRRMTTKEQKAFFDNFKTISAKNTLESIENNEFKITF